MEIHSTVEQPPEESHSPVYTLLGGFIALLTLALPLYITTHYSSATPTATMGTPVSPPALVQRQ
jgi:hypothetical protein